MRMLRAGLLALAVAGAVANVGYGAVVAGNLYRTPDGQGSTVDHWKFTVNTAGTTTIDLLAYEYNWNTGTYHDVNGDGEIAFFDPFIYLFRDDGSLSTADIVASNDDSGSTFGDGSVYGYDSYLNVGLSAGNYILAVGAYFLTATDAIDRVNSPNGYPQTMGFATHDHGDYQITFSNNVGNIANVDAAAVPEPATMTIWGLGALGCAVASYRRKRKLAA